MTFDDPLAQICDLFQCQGRVSYWALQRRFDLSDNDLEGIKVELIEVQELAMDRDGKMLVWTGGVCTTPAPAAPAPPPAPPSDTPAASGLQAETLPTAPRSSGADLQLVH